MKITWENPRVEPRYQIGDLRIGELFTLPPTCEPIYIKTQVNGMMQIGSNGTILISSEHAVEPCEAIEIKVRRVR